MKLLIKKKDLKLELIDLLFRVHFVTKMYELIFQNDIYMF